MHKTAASLPGADVCALSYASLYPFAEWRNQDILPWAFLAAPFPRYWTRFDVAINIMGYVPLGSMLALSALRSGRSRQALWLSVLIAGVLSLVMEALQSYLPARVPSREDWLLNTLGGALGAAATVALEKLGAIDRWSRFRARWFVPHARGGLVLLATWPVALLFPAAVPFGWARFSSGLKLRWRCSWKTRLFWIGCLCATLNCNPWFPAQSLPVWPLVYSFPVCWGSASFVRRCVGCCSCRCVLVSAYW